MAALTGHVRRHLEVLSTIVRHKSRYHKPLEHTRIRYVYKDKTPKQPPKVNKTIHSTRESIAAKGFLRNFKEYIPPPNSNERLDQVLKNEGLSLKNDTPLDDALQKFNLLVACEKEFDHAVPNSTLHEIETIRDLREFYETPVNTTTPLDYLARASDLPKNLHVQQNYIRFHPDTDTAFGGKTAFPRSSTLVTGISSRKLYPSYVVKKEWPYV